MTLGRTTWWPKDAAWHRREGVVELGEEHGPAGPMVVDVLCAWAQEQRAAGAVRGGFRGLAREAFVTVEVARSVTSHAASRGVLDEFEVDPDGRRFTCRVSGWEQDQARGRAALRQATKRDRDRAVTPERDASRAVTPSSLPDQTIEERSNDLSMSPTSGDGEGEDLPVQLDEARQRLQAEAVDRVWSTYDAARREVLGERSQAKLTSSRRQLIARRLREWPVEDLLDAVQGWRHSPHHRGENERGTPYCDLELLLRGPAHIERFRDLQRDPPRRGGASAPTGSRERKAVDLTFRLFADEPGLYHHVRAALAEGATTDDEVRAHVEGVQAAARAARGDTTATERASA